MNTDEATDVPPLKEETPQPDAPVAVEWWYSFTDEGEPDLDTHHGFHDAERVCDGSPPSVQEGELLTESGAAVAADCKPDDMRESRYLYLSHRDALSRDSHRASSAFQDTRRIGGSLKHERTEFLPNRASKGQCFLCGYDTTAIRDGISTLFTIRTRLSSIELVRSANTRDQPPADLGTRWDRLEGVSIHRSRKPLL